ncbi:MAG TPA: thiamine pyrophosphate-binding protein [Baekduia sp.]
MKVYEAVADALVREQVGRVFGLMGDGNMELLAELTQRRGVEFVKVRHEQGAVAMADGYARASGAVGVCTVTCGPALLNTATSLAVARAHGSAVVLLAGDTPADDPGHLQNVDQQRFGAALAATTIDVTDPGDVAARITEAFVAARSGHGPVLVNLPMDVQGRDLPGAWSYTPAVAPASAAAETVAPSAAAIAEAAQVILSAERPAMIVGRGAIGAETAVLALAEAAGTPFATTLQATGLGGRHALSLGNAGLMGSPEAFALMQEADVLLVVGASLSRLTTGFGRLVEGARIVAIDHDPAAAGRADVLVLGDAGAGAAALERELARRGDPTARASAAAARVPEDPYPFTPEHGVGTVDPRSVFVALDELLPANQALVMDAGHFISFAGPLLRIGRPVDWIFPTDIGCIGQSLSTAIGAAAAREGERVTVVAGDAGFLMGISELETAARYGVPLTIVVINDEGWGQEAHMLALKDEAPELALAATPDLALLAEGFGAAGHRVRSAEDLAGLPAVLAAAVGPLVIDVRVNPAIKNWVVHAFALAGHDIRDAAAA